MTTPLSFSGYPVHDYAIRRYGAAFCADRIAQVEYCTHDDRCEDCCFLYTGKIHTLQSTKGARKPNPQYYLPMIGHHRRGKVIDVSIRGFFRQLVFGCYYRMARFFPTCTTFRCTNLWHHDMHHSFSTVDDIFTRIKLCVHGWLCELCHWEWVGYYLPSGKSKNSQVTYTPLLRSNVLGVHMTVAQYLARRKLGYAIPAKGFVERVCHNERCVSFWHLGLTTKKALYAYARPFQKRNRSRNAHHAVR